MTTDGTKTGLARTKSFRDDNGNRFIIPSYVIYPDDPDAPSATDIMLRAIELSCLGVAKAEDNWFEFDPEKFPHVQSVARSRAFLHGGATVLIFEGPEFEAARAASEAKT